MSVSSSLGSSSTERSVSSCSTERSLSSYSTERSVSSYSTERSVSSCSTERSLSSNSTNSSKSITNSNSLDKDDMSFHAEGDPVFESLLHGWKSAPRRAPRLSTSAAEARRKRESVRPPAPSQKRPRRVDPDMYEYEEGVQEHRGRRRRGSSGTRRIWSEDEDVKLRELVAKYNQRHWKLIARGSGERGG